LVFEQLAGSKLIGSDCEKHRWRNYLVRISSTGEYYRPEGTKGERPVWTSGAILHYAVVYIDDLPMAFAYVEHVNLVKYHPGPFGYAAVTHCTESILGLGGVQYYLSVASVAQVLATIEREGVHSIDHSREPFSKRWRVGSLHRSHHRSFFDHLTQRRFTADFANEVNDSPTSTVPVPPCNIRPLGSPISLPPSIEGASPPQDLGNEAQRECLPRLPVKSALQEAVRHPRIQGAGRGSLSTAYARGVAWVAL